MRPVSTLLATMVAARLAQGVLLVFVVVAVFLGVLDLIQELEDIGEGRYRTYDALWVVFLTLPGRVSDSAPIIVFLGTLVGLGRLARGSELVAMQAAGISWGFIARAVSVMAVLLAALSILFLEVLVPVTAELAHRHRALRLSPLQSQRPLHPGVDELWFKANGRFVHIKHPRAGYRVFDVDLYAMNERGGLAQFQQVREASWDEDRRRAVGRFQGRTFTDAGVRYEKGVERPIDLGIGAHALRLLTLPLDRLSLRQLARYAAIRARLQLSDQAARLALWRKFGTVLSLPIAMLLAATLGLGSVRYPTMSRRLVWGGGLGVVALLGSRLAGDAAGVLAADPAAAALLPVLGLALGWGLAVLGLSRYRARPRRPSPPAD